MTALRPRRAAAIALSCAMGIVSLAAPACASSPAGSWRFTVYYTAVESLHHGAPVTVRGCPILDCANGHTVLGRFPRDFVRIVEEEGTGRITSGPHAGGYLEWSDGIGYWLDTVARDSYGHRLVAFRTAAADASTLRRGQSFRISVCGHDTDSGDREDPGACRQLEAAHWIVQDQFTPGLGGSRHLDLYIGEERGAHFEDVSPLYLDASGGRIVLT